MVRLGIDLGGTNIAVGVVNEQNEIIGTASVKTNAPRPAEEIADSMREACLLALGEAQGCRLIADDTQGDNISQSVMIARVAFTDNPEGARARSG